MSWTHEQTSAGTDPLAEWHGRPMISQQPAGVEYLGRLVIELWSGPDDTDSNNVAYTVDSPLVDPQRPDTARDTARRLASAVVGRMLH